ncbi:MAG: sugar phosphate isomerase/epimerase [Sedimentisphaerales bacterium]|nr:sugar phosphate isomerase/epimerase [Sedimentisphaerales bacterium]
MSSEGMSRRRFVGAAAAVAGLATLESAHAQNTQVNKPGIKVGLYSITFLGLWYQGKELSLEHVVRKAREYGYDGVEIDGKRPHGNPNDWPTRRCKQLRSMADDEGIEIYAVAGNNDFSSPICEHRECQIVYLRELIRMASDMGATAVRVFLAWPGVTRQPQIGTYTLARNIWDHTHSLTTGGDDWSRCRDALAECARYAADYGVTLALQNHAPIVTSYKDVLRMIKQVNSPRLKACIDLPLLSDKSPEGIRTAVNETGPLEVLSHFGGEFERTADGSVVNDHENETFPPFIREMKKIGYSGYMGYELCHPLPVVDGQTVGIEFAEKNAKLAAEFMHGLIKG